MCPNISLVVRAIPLKSLDNRWRFCVHHVLPVFGDSHSGLGKFMDGDVLSMARQT